jgi:hypothetical protein
MQTTMPARAAAWSCPPLSFAEVAGRISSLMLTEDCRTALHEEATNPLDELAHKRVASSTPSARSTDEILQDLQARGWIEGRTLDLITTRFSTQPPVSPMYLGALECLLQEAAEREDKVDNLSRKASSYGLVLPVDLLSTVARLDQIGSDRFAAAVQRTESLLRSFEGPSCDDLARDLIAFCLQRGYAESKLELVNEFLAITPKLSRGLTEEILKTQPIFDTAIERGWLLPEESRSVKEFLSNRPHLAWPIIHALKAIRAEIFQRSQAIRILETKGLPIPEGIGRLKDVASNAASSQFLKLLNGIEAHQSPKGKR